MVAASWRIEEPPPGSGVRLGPPLVSVRYLMDALRRRWRTWVGGALIGLMLGIAYVAMVPVAAIGSVTLLLAHPEGVDPTSAMATDISLLRTRTVAHAATEQLDLDVSPEQFQRSVVALPLTSQVLQLDVAAPDSAAALQYVRVLARTFLDFRAATLETEANATINGYEQQLSTLKQQVEQLTAQYDSLAAQGPGQQDSATAVLTRRSQLSEQIGTLQAQIDDARLKSEALVRASHVVDSPAVVPQSGLRRAVLAVGTATVGGLAVGVALVVFSALTTDRLRRRDEVALALGVPVRASVGGPHRSRLLRLPHLPWHRQNDAELAVLAHALGTAVPTTVSSGPRRLLIAAIDNVQAVELLTATLAADLSAQGELVLAVDLGERGGLAAQLVHALRRSDGSGLAAAPTVLRPDGVPHLATGPFGVPAGTTGIVSDDDSRRRAWVEADVALILTSVRVGSELDLLSTWADDVVVVVTAGQSSAERLRTTAELLRSAGLHMPFALMLSSDQLDESLGVPDEPDSGEGPTRKAAQ